MWNTVAGYVTERKCVLGGHIVIYDRKNGADWIDADERWIVMHEPSSRHVALTSRKHAYEAMRHAAAGGTDYDIFSPASRKTMTDNSDYCAELDRESTLLDTKRKLSLNNNYATL